jgi:hypothetical protein
MRCFWIVRVRSLSSECSRIWRPVDQKFAITTRLQWDTKSQKCFSILT